MRGFWSPEPENLQNNHGAGLPGVREETVCRS